MSTRLQVPFLASLRRLKIWCFHELRCWLQIRLGSSVAVAEASSCSSDSTPSLLAWEHSYAMGAVLQSPPPHPPQKRVSASGVSTRCHLPPDPQCCGVRLAPLPCPRTTHSWVSSQLETSTEGNAFHPTQSKVPTIFLGIQVLGAQEPLQNHLTSQHLHKMAPKCFLANTFPPIAR